MSFSTVKVDRPSMMPRYSSLQPHELAELERTDTYVVVVWGRLMLLVWRDTASPAGVERSRELFDRWFAQNPGGGAFLIVIPEHRTRAPDAHTFEAMARTADAPVSQCRGMAVLLEFEGFIAASVRAIMMRLHSIAAREDPPLVFGASDKAARWASALLNDPKITATALAEVIRVAREGT